MLEWNICCFRGKKYKVLLGFCIVVIFSKESTDKKRGKHGEPVFCLHLAFRAVYSEWLLVQAWSRLPSMVRAASFLLEATPRMIVGLGREVLAGPL